MIKIEIDLGLIAKRTAAMLYVIMAGIVLLFAALFLADGQSFSPLATVILAYVGLLMVAAIRYIIRSDRYGS